MTTTSLLPGIAGGLFVLYLLYTAIAGGKASERTWLLPATLSLVFLGFSLHTVSNEGLDGVWVEHTRNLWGNQIWFDLLLAVAIGWTLMLPRARRLGMSLLPWLVFVVATGCVGLLAMLARVRYLETRARTKAN